MRIGWLVDELEEAHAGLPDDTLLELNNLAELYELLGAYEECLEYVDRLSLDRDPRTGAWQFTAFNWGDGPGQSYSCIWPLSLVGREQTVEGFLRLMSGNANHALQRAVLYGELAPVGELRWK